MREFGAVVAMFYLLTVVKQSIHMLKLMELYTKVCLLNRKFLKNCTEITFLPCQISKKFKV